MSRNRSGAWLPSVTRALPAYLLVLPTVLLIAIFVWFPLLRAGQASLYQWDGVGALGKFVGVQNYQHLFLDDPIFRSALRNTLIWAAMYTAIPTAIGLAVALLVDSDVRGEATSLHPLLDAIPFSLSAGRE